MDQIWEKITQIKNTKPASFEAVMMTLDAVVKICTETYLFFTEYGILPQPTGKHKPDIEFSISDYRKFRTFLQTHCQTATCLPEGLQIVLESILNRITQDITRTQETLALDVAPELIDTCQKFGIANQKAEFLDALVYYNECGYLKEYLIATDLMTEGCYLVTNKGNMSKETFEILLIAWYKKTIVLHKKTPFKTGVLQNINSTLGKLL